MQSPATVVPTGARVGADGVLRAPGGPGTPHVVLVRPPLRVPRASYSTLACPPLALALLAAAVEAAGMRVTVVDAVGLATRRYAPLPNRRFLRLGLDDADIVARVPADATCIGVTATFSEDWPLVRHVIRVLRDAFPHTPLLAGGEHTTAVAEFCLRDSRALDVCVLGEGEQTLVELVRALRSGASLRGVPGIAFLADGDYVRTAARPRIRDVASIPRPAWHRVPLERYLDDGLAYGIGRTRSVPILATRGCPYQCTFCSSPRMWTTRWYSRDPADVVDEMREGVERYGAQNFDFYDLTAWLKKDWIVEFCHRLRRADLGVTFQIPSGTRSEVLDAEVLPLLRSAGCSHLVYAPESGSQPVLGRIKKRAQLDRMAESMAIAVRSGLTVKCNFIIGFPDETFEEALQTLRYCLRLADLGVQDVNLGPFCPYPGSELYLQLAQAGRLQPLGDDYFDMLSMYSDLSRTVSWSNHLTSRQLTTLRFTGMGAFYSRAFYRRPRRFAELAHGVATGRHRTRLDRSLADFGRRLAGSLVPPGPTGPDPGPRRR